MIDAHAHVGDSKFDADRDAVMNRAADAGLSAIVCVGQDYETSIRALALKQRGHARLQLAATTGLHPHEASRASEELPGIEALAGKPEIDALGETGLDFYYNFSPRESQRESFRWHLALAKKVNKPVVVHVREAHAEAMEDIGSCGAGVTTMIHCFTGDATQARKYLNLGAYISFSGILTFKNSEAIRDAARIVPLDRLLVETDSPFLSPEGHRGKRCEPAFVVTTTRFLGELRGVATREVAEATAANATLLFFRGRVGNT